MKQLIIENPELIKDFFQGLPPIGSRSRRITYIKSILAKNMTEIGLTNKPIREMLNTSAQSVSSLKRYDREEFSIPENIIIEVIKSKFYQI